jgi:ubiquinol-cytochrome c reductase cytochrome c subunit
LLLKDGNDRTVINMKTFFTIVFFLAASSSAFAQGNAEHGKVVFEKLYCSACHGHDGQGGSSGPRIGVKPPALTALIAYVRKPAGGMPPFTSKIVSDADLADIHAYLSSRPAPPALKDVPLLNQ